MIDKWELQLRKGIIELVIMLLVKHEAKYGYEVTKSLQEIPQLRLSEGAIYPILKRLENQQLLSSYWSKSQAGPRRKYYILTAKGFEVAEERLHSFQEATTVIHLFQKGELK